jgi:hypothetical protein
VSVCGTVDQPLHQTSSRLLRLSRIAFGLPRQLSITSQERLLSPHGLRRGLQPHARPTSKHIWLPCPRSRGNACTTGRYRNINLLSIAYGYYPLGLGPTNPTRIHLPSETLGLRRTRFARAFSLLIPAFALRRAPGHLTASPSLRPNAPLPLERVSLFPGLRPRNKGLSKPWLRWWA